MRLFTIITIILIYSTSCKAQEFSKSLKTDVVTFYIEINELEEKDKQELLKNFEGLFTITDLQNSEIRYSNNTSGLFKISPNISHTTSNVILCSNGSCAVLKANINSIPKIIDFIKDKDEIDKLNAIRYIESFLNLIRENKDIKESNTLEFKDN